MTFSPLYANNAYNHTEKYNLYAQVRIHKECKETIACFSASWVVNTAFNFISVFSYYHLQKLMARSLPW